MWEASADRKCGYHLPMSVPITRDNRDLVHDVLDCVLPQKGNVIADVLMLTESSPQWASRCHGLCTT